MGLITLFGTIYGFHYTISANFYLHLQYFFQQKNFSFNKINESQMDPKCDFRLYLMNVGWFNSSTRQ